MGNADRSRRKRMRDRRAAIALIAALAAVPAIGAAVYFPPLAAQYAEGPSAEAAIEWAERQGEWELAYSLEREYVDDEGRTVYRLVSDSQPAVVKEMRYGFRWFPEVSVSPAVVPSVYVSDPGPYYGIANEDEWRESAAEWRSAQMRREAESVGSLRDETGRGGADG